MRRVSGYFNMLSVRGIFGRSVSLQKQLFEGQKTAFKALQIGSYCKMSSKISPAPRIDGIDKNVWIEFTTLAAQHKALNLGQGFPDFSPPPYIKEEVATVVTGENELMNQYTRGFGHPRLVNAIANTFKPLLGVDINPLNDIIITAGAYGALFSAFQAFVQPGDEVIIIEPFFDCYQPMALMAGGIPKFIPLRPQGDGLTTADWKLDTKELESLFNSKTKAIVLNNPNNPLGKMYTREELTIISELCKKHDVLCISDEVYEWLTYTGNNHVRIASLPGMWDRTITIGSAGKTFSVTGWKLGWAIAPAHLTKHLQTVWQNALYNVCTPIQEAVARGFERENGCFGEADCYFQSLPRELEGKRDNIANVLQTAGFKPIIPEGGYFMVADTSGIKVDFGDDNLGETNDYRFVKWLIKNKKVATIPVSAFYSKEHAHLAAKYIRFCFAKVDSTFEKLNEIFQKWKKEQK